jgi:competence protein CoiA
MTSTQKIRADIADGLKNQPNVSGVALQKQFGKRKTDIFALINESPVAIQLFYDHLSLKEVEKRTVYFNKYGLAVIWIFPRKFSRRFYTRKSYSWCHAAFYGQVYCHHVGQQVLPVHFKPATTYIDRRKWLKEGCEKIGGGYKKPLKRIKNAIEEEPISLAQNFCVRHKKTWSNEKIQIPECNLFIRKNLNSEVSDD